VTDSENAGPNERPVRKPGLISRRRLLAAAFLSAPFLALADSTLVEPKWVVTRRFRLGKSKPTHRIVHFTDVHWRP
jgi:hypothetical protein